MRGSGRITALALGSVVALAGAEVFCRLAGLGDPAPVVVREERRPGERIPYVPGSQLRYVYPDDPRGYFDDDLGVRGSINAQGFRGADTPVGKPPGRIRVAMLGDSFTLGMGVRDEDTLPALLERALGSPDVEVLNFGVSGTDTPEQMLYFAQRVVAFRPDVVVTLVFLNDATEQSTIEFLGQPRYLRSLRGRSHLLDAVLAAVERREQHQELVRIYLDAYQEGAAGWTAVQEALRVGHQFAEGLGVDFVVALHPILFQLGPDYPFAPAHEAIARFCREEGIAFVDLFPAFAGEVDRSLWVHRVDQHPNEIANRLSASALARFFAGERLLERRRALRGAPRPRPPVAGSAILRDRP